MILKKHTSSVGDAFDQVRKIIVQFGSLSAQDNSAGRQQMSDSIDCWCIQSASHHRLSYLMGPDLLVLVTRSFPDLLGVFWDEMVGSPPAEEPGQLRDLAARGIEALAMATAELHANRILTGLA